MKHFILKSLTLGLGIVYLGTGNAALDIYSDLDSDSAYDSVFNVTPGSTFKVSVYAQEDGLHGGLTSYAVEVNLDAPLKVEGANEALQLANLESNVQWDLPETKSVTPNLEIIDGTFFGAYNGAVHLFDMMLEAPNLPGIYNISFKNVEPDATFDGFAGFDGFVYDSTNLFQATQITVVPVPAALPLFATALAGLGWQVRRRRS